MSAVAPIGRRHESRLLVKKHENSVVSIENLDKGGRKFTILAFIRVIRGLFSIPTQQEKPENSDKNSPFPLDIM
jgi:hypothetical protein